MTEFKEGDLVQVPAHRARYSYHTGEVGLVVEASWACRLDELAYDVAWIGVVWPHVADIRWYCTSDLVKVTEDD